MQKSKARGSGRGRKLAALAIIGTGAVFGAFAGHALLGQHVTLEGKAPVFGMDNGDIFDYIRIEYRDGPYFSDLMDVQAVEQRGMHWSAFNGDYYVVSRVVESEGKVPEAWFKDVEISGAHNEGGQWHEYTIKDFTAPDWETHYTLGKHSPYRDGADIAKGNAVSVARLVSGNPSLTEDTVYFQESHYNDLPASVSMYNPMEMIGVSMQVGHKMLGLENPDLPDLDSAFTVAGLKSAISRQGTVDEYVTPDGAVYGALGGGASALPYAMLLWGDGKKKHLA